MVTQINIDGGPLLAMGFTVATVEEERMKESGESRQLTEGDQQAFHTACTGIASLLIICSKPKQHRR
jgi:hypothetical protein